MLGLYLVRIFLLKHQREHNLAYNLGNLLFKLSHTALRGIVLDYMRAMASE